MTQINLKLGTYSAQFGQPRQGAAYLLKNETNLGVLTQDGRFACIVETNNNNAHLFGADEAGE